MAAATPPTTENAPRGITVIEMQDLAAPIPREDVKQRQGPGGMLLDYIDARVVFDRLDTVCGPWWQTEYDDTVGGTRCRLSILIEGRWVTRSDVGTPSDIEPVKGAHSDAIKRAAVQFGIGRELYDSRPEAAGPRQPQPQQSQRPPLQQGQYPQAQQAPRPQQQPAVQQGISQFGPNGEPWVCPIHGTVKAVAGGVSKKPPFKPYNAFYSCPDQNCGQRPPYGLAVRPSDIPAPYVQQAAPYADQQYVDSQTGVAQEF